MSTETKTDEGFAFDSLFVGGTKDGVTIRAVPEHVEVGPLDDIPDDVEVFGRKLTVAETLYLISELADGLARVESHRATQARS